MVDTEECPCPFLQQAHTLTKDTLQHDRGGRSDCRQGAAIAYMHQMGCNFANNALELGVVTCEFFKYEKERGP